MEGGRGGKRERGRGRLWRHDKIMMKKYWFH